MAGTRGRRRRERKKHRGSNKTSIIQQRRNNDDGGGLQKGHLLRHRAQVLARIISQYPEQIANGLASREDAGWLFGCLFLVGAISSDQKIAAERLSRSVATYRRLLHRNPSFRLSMTSDFGIGGGRSQGEDLSPSAEKALVRATIDYNMKISILRECGENVEKAVMTALDHDRITNLDLICQGLTALSMGREAGYVEQEVRVAGVG